jgi:malate dehydrogenase (quinone)
MPIAVATRIPSCDDHHHTITDLTEELVTGTSTTIDVALIGGGIMSATLGTLLQHLRPDWSIVVFERLDDVARESSGGWNNAGTGHAAYCELNYTPEAKDGTIDVSRAIKVNEQFHLSRQLWASLVEQGDLESPDTFIHSTPHITFVTGDDDVNFLQRRHAAMSRYPHFANMRYSEDRDEIAHLIPLMLERRDSNENIAITRADEGTDVDYGAMTRQLFASLQRNGADVRTSQSIHGLRKLTDGTWNLSVKHRATGESSEATARFVFVGAGGRAIQLLQQSGIAEARGYAGFPVSGQFLQCTNPELIARHHVKVYGKPHLGAPPMSAPHLDTRVIDGKPGLLFGPYAGFSPKLLKFGSALDFFGSIRLHNILTMLSVARSEIPLTKYLIGEVLQSSSGRLKALREFIPNVEGSDWKLITAGQRVQVMKPTAKKRGVLQFGTELITAADGSIAGLLGASPGASTGTAIMLDLIETCFKDDIAAWRPKLQEMIPSYGTSLAKDPVLLSDISRHTDTVLKLNPANVQSSAQV